MERLDPLGLTDRRKQRMQNAERIWLLALSVLAICVILAALVVTASVSPSFCAACHSKEASALASSPHKSVTCDQCHTGASTFGLIESRLGTIDMIVRQVTPGPKHVAAEIDSQRCLMCHLKTLRKTVVKRGIRMSHRTPLDQGWTCDQCHAGAAHGAVGASRMRYTMDTCMQCHSSNAKDVTGCRTCHTDAQNGIAADKSIRTPWRVTHGQNWQQTHGMGDLRTCRECHPDNYCAQCHNMNVPHPDGYRSTHGPEVLSRDTGPKDCLVCHKTGSCDNCHGIEMPHPQGFLQRHKATVQTQGSKVCERCHDPKSCESCHTRHTHPGLPVDFRQWLQARPIQ
ncbi:MAG TPA: hypothetical protein VGK50_08275 [Coriobacteriia bacterium]|jgi:ribosomal protein L40E